MAIDASPKPGLKNGHTRNSFLKISYHKISNAHAKNTQININGHGSPLTISPNVLKWMPQRKLVEIINRSHVLNTKRTILSLTHWGRVMHICVSKLTIIGSVNGLSPGRRQAIIWTNAGMLLIGTLETNFSEILAKLIHCHSRKCFWKCRLRKGVYLLSASIS